MTFEPIEHTDSSATILVTTTADVAFEDRTELVRVLVSPTATHAIYLVNRRPGVTARADVLLHVDALGAIMPVWRPAPTGWSELPMPTEVLTYASALTAADGTLDRSERLRLCTTALEALDVQVQRAAYAELSLQLGVHLLDTALPTGDDVERARRAFRRAYTLETEDFRIRRQALLGIGRARAVASLGHEEPDVEPAVAAVAESVNVAAISDATEDWCHAVALLDALESSAGIEPGRAEQQLQGSRADTTLAISLGDAYLALDVPTSDGFRQWRARMVWTDALSHIVDHAGPIDIAREPGRAQAISTLYARLLDLDKAVLGASPRGRGRRRDHQRKALYLRPFLGGHHMIVANRFEPTVDLQWAFDSEPPFIDLEDALYRVLFDVFDVAGLGGVPSPFGAGRLYMLGAGADTWRVAVKALYDTGDLVVMVPHESEGVAWELDFLLAHEGLPRTLFVMPPELRNLDASAMWNAAASLFASRGCGLPPYVPTGALFMLGSGGSTARQWSFDVVWRAELAARLFAVLPQCRETCADRGHRPPATGDQPPSRIGSTLAKALLDEFGSDLTWTFDDDLRAIRVQSDSPLGLEKRHRLAGLAQHHNVGVWLDEGGTIAVWHPRG